MRIGAVTLPYENLTFEKAAGHLAKFGFEMVEIHAWRSSKHLNIDRIREERGTFKKVLMKHGLEISALNNSWECVLILGPHDESTDDMYKGTAAEKTKFGMDRMIKTAEAARLLDVPVVVGMTGTPAWRWYPFPPANEQLFEQSWQAFGNRFGELMDQFGRYGVKYACEVHSGNQVYNLETVRRALKELNGRKEFGINLDPSHLAWQMIDLVTYIKEFGSRIYHAHAKDVEVENDVLPISGVLPPGSFNRPNRGLRFRTPGWGDINWKRVMTALAEVKYDYVLSYEHEDPVIAPDDGMKKALDFLRPLLIRTES